MLCLNWVLSWQTFGPVQHKLKFSWLVLERECYLVTNFVFIFGLCLFQSVYNPVRQKVLPTWVMKGKGGGSNVPLSTRGWAGGGGWEQHASQHEGGMRGWAGRRGVRATCLSVWGVEGKHLSGKYVGMWTHMKKINGVPWPLLVCRDLSNYQWGVGRGTHVLWGGGGGREAIM